MLEISCVLEINELKLIEKNLELEWIDIHCRFFFIIGPFGSGNKNNLVVIDWLFMFIVCCDSLAIILSPFIHIIHCYFLFGWLSLLLCLWCIFVTVGCGIFFGFFWIKWTIQQWLILVIIDLGHLVYKKKYIFEQNYLRQFL